MQANYIYFKILYNIVRLVDFHCEILMIMILKDTLSSDNQSQNDNHQ